MKYTTPEDVTKYVLKSIPHKYFTQGNPEHNYLLISNVTVTTVTLLGLSATISCFDCFSGVLCNGHSPFLVKDFLIYNSMGGDCISPLVVWYLPAYIQQNILLLFTLDMKCMERDNENSTRLILRPPPLSLHCLSMRLNVCQQVNSQV